MNHPYSLLCGKNSCPHELHARLFLKWSAMTFDARISASLWLRSPLFAAISQIYRIFPPFRSSAFPGYACCRNHPSASHSPALPGCAPCFAAPHQAQIRSLQQAQDRPHSGQASAPGSPAGIYCRDGTAVMAYQSISKRLPHQHRMSTFRQARLGKFCKCSREGRFRSCMKFCKKLTYLMWRHEIFPVPCIWANSEFLDAPSNLLNFWHDGSPGNTRERQITRLIHDYRRFLF